MGVLPQVQQRVALVLRGGRQTGRSATATAMAYRRSEDGDWHFKAAGQQACSFTDDVSMTQALGYLRLQMEGRVLADDEPCVVDIPCDCFDPRTANTLRIRMLDLPGDNPGNAVERAHVQKMAKRYVPHADLILLIGRGDDLSFLRPDALELPSIEDWQIVPRRFRIVTTYSFTAETVLEIARKHKDDIDSLTFRQRLLQQIKTFGLTLSEDASQPERFFPLEFGDSWANPASNHRDVVEALSPMIDSLKEQLRADIMHSATEFARLRSAVDVHVVVRQIKDARLKGMVSDLTHVDKVFNDANQNCDSTKRGLSDAECELERARSRATAVAPCARKAQIKASSELAKFKDGSLAAVRDLVKKPSTNVPAFRQLIVQFSSDLRKQLLKMRPKPSDEVPAWFWRSEPLSLEDQRADAGRQIDDEFSYLEAKLRSYKTDEYWPSISDDHAKDMALMGEAMERSIALIRNIAESHWSKAAIRIQKKLDRASQEADVNVASWRQSLKDASAASSAARLKLSRVQATRDKYVAKMEEEESASRQFLTVLDEEYVVELRNRRKELLESGSASDALVDLLAAVQLGHQRQRLLGDL